MCRALVSFSLSLRVCVELHQRASQACATAVLLLLVGVFVGISVRLIWCVGGIGAVLISYASLLPGLASTSAMGIHADVVEKARHTRPHIRRHRDHHYHFSRWFFFSL